MSIKANLISTEDSPVPLVELKYRGSTIEPLQRGLTDTDIRHNLTLDLADNSIEFPNKISVASRHMPYEKWSALETNSGFESTVTSIHSTIRMSPAVLKIFYPLHTIDFRPTETQQENLIDAARQGGVSGIPILDVADSSKEFLEHRLKKFRPEIETRGCEAIPAVAMPDRKKATSFYEKMELLKDYKEPMVLIPYRGLNSHRREYLFLKKFASKTDMCIALVNAPREALTMATSHILPFYGANLVSLAIPRPFPRKNSEDEFSIATRRWFDRDLTHRNLLTAMHEDPSFALEDCKKIGLIHPSKLINNATNVQAVNSASRVFDVAIGQDEFSVLKKFAENDEAEEYISSKPVLDKALEALL